MPARGPAWRPEKHDPILKGHLEDGLSVYAIADRMNFSHQTVERHMRRVVGGEQSRAKEAETRYQAKKAAAEMPAVVAIPWEYARGSEETPLHYADRVLKRAGKLPVVSLQPGDKIRRANVELKGRGLPQIADRPEWVQ